MCLKSPISICRLEKYLASIKITTNFIISDGWKEKLPRENQLLAPFDVCPKNNNNNKSPKKEIKSATKISVLFKNLKSIKEREKSAIKEMPIQSNWWEKNGELSVKDFIVTRPARRTGNIKAIRSQSIPRRDFIKI